jgi:uncharacterized metal-binding protein YceD (DUF177 family)
MTAPEFPRPVRIGSGRRQVTLEATEAERAALARRFGILGLGALTAELDLSPGRGGVTLARGRLRAEVTQECVATGDPVEQRVDAPLDLRILPEGTPARDDDPDSPDEIETTGDTVDLGEVVAEQLALALDPYPRLPDAEIELPDDPVEEVEAKPNPFAALAKLRRG